MFNTKTISMIVLTCIATLYGLAGFTGVDPGWTVLKIPMMGSDTGNIEVVGVGTHWFDPVINDVEQYDTRSVQYPLPDVDSNTKDGQPVKIDLSMEIDLVSDSVPILHNTVGHNWYEQVVLPATRASIRQRAAALPSDEIYTSEGRMQLQKAIQNDVGDTMLKRGIRIVVNLRDITFTNSNFIASLEEKAVAAQRVLIADRNAQAAVFNATKVSNDAEGEKQKRIKAAEANAEEQKLEGIGSRARKEQDAMGVLAIAKAEAEGIRLKVTAFGDGKTYASVRWAEEMGANVKVYAFPTGAAGTSSVMDLNGVFKGAFSGVDPK